PADLHGRRKCWACREHCPADLHGRRKCWASRRRVGASRREILLILSQWHEARHPRSATSFRPSTVNRQPSVMRVLIVEDEPKLAERIHAALVRAGMVADIAPDGSEAQFLGET